MAGGEAVAVLKMGAKYSLVGKKKKKANEVKYLACKFFLLSVGNQQDSFYFLCSASA